jgi:hypothetical protein
MIITLLKHDLSSHPDEGLSWVLLNLCDLYPIRTVPEIPNDWVERVRDV